MGAKDIFPFFLEQAQHIAGMNCLRLTFLKLNQKRIAFEYAWHVGQQIYKPKVGYDAAYADLSPGNLLELLHFQAMHEDHRIACVDFMGPRPAREQHWINQRYRIGTFLLGTRGITSRMFAALYRRRRERTVNRTN